jgi:hypothetical protein
MPSFSSFSHQQQQKQQNPASDLRYSHVDIIVEDLHAFLDQWCPRLGLVPSEIQTWGSPEESTWSEFALVFSPYDGALVFMVVQGKKGWHVDLLQQHGSGTIYRLLFPNGLFGNDV